MKKPLLISLATVAVVGLTTATTLYAQTTTGTSLVDKMKAAVHSFTLAADLNPGQTGLDSAPIKGKKTGDILTAGEWNRVLELMGQGSSSGCSATSGNVYDSGWKDFPTNKSEVTITHNLGTLDTMVYYEFKGDDNFTIANGDSPVLQPGKAHDYAIGLYQNFYNKTENEVKIHKYGDYNTKSVRVVVVKTSALGGGCGTSSGSAQIVEGGIIKTSAKTISNWDLITLEGSWNSGGGDAAPTGGYIYKLNGQPKLAYVEASGISKDIALTTTAQNVHNLTVKLSGDSVIIDPSSTNTLAYVVWKFSGGSGSSASTCPSGFVAVGSYCIEPTMNPKGKTWYDAGVACADKGAQLCQWSEWAIACKKGALTDVKFGTTLGVYEWIDDYTGDAYQGIADPRVYSNCEYLSRADPKGGTTPVANIAYRCCTSQK